MKHKAIILSGLFAFVLFADEDPMAAIESSVKEAAKIQYKNTRRIVEGSAKVPMKRRDSYSFKSTAGEQFIYYNRYMNQPPQFTGKHPSLGPEMGVGFGERSFSNWYGNDCIRVMIDKTDIMQLSPAKVTHREDEAGHLTMVWDMKNGRSLTLDFYVFPENDRIYVRGTLKLPGLPVENVQVRLRCFPGGFGPAYNIPSNRYFKADCNVSGEAFARAEKKTLKMKLDPNGKWIFLADRLQKKGSVALLFDPNEEGNFMLSHSYYGSTIELNYPGDVRTFHLALYAHEIQNDPAFAKFMARIEKDFKEMHEIKY